MFKWKSDLSEEDRIRQNIQNMVELKKGELAYDRYLGMYPEWVDKPAGIMNAEMLSDATSMLNTKEPRVKSSIEFTDQNEMYIVLDETEEEVEE